MCPSNPDGLTPPGAQTGRLIRAGVPRQLVAIIYDTGPSTYRLCWITLSAGRKGVKKRVLHNIAPKKSSRKNSSYVSFIIQAELQLP